MNIVARNVWGARPPKSRTAIRLPVRGLWLHHTAGNERGAAGMRAIQSFHMDVRGWDDIAYSWVYDPINRTFYEGRGAGAAGAHTQGHNSTAHALCVMGNFDRMAVPPTLVDDLAAFVRWHGRHGPDRFTGGHRDVGSTSCPGDKLYRLIPNINAAAATTQPEDDDMTAEQERKLDQAHAVLTRIDRFLQLSGLMDADGRPKRNVALDLQVTRKGIRSIAAKLGLTVKYDVPDEVDA